MPRRKAGFSYVGLQVPDEVCDLIHKEMEAKGQTMAEIIMGLLVRHYRLRPASLPPRGSAGRPRKPKA